jgi:hypothetical protein
MGYVQANLHNRVGIPTSANVDDTIAQRIMLPTNIGTPMGTSDGASDVNELSIQLTTPGKKDPYFMYMSHWDQMHKSGRVIEIGAMAVVNQPIPCTVSQVVLDQEGSRREMIMKKLEDVEKHLKQEMGNHNEGLKGCEMIREVFARKHEPKNAGVEEATQR